MVDLLICVGLAISEYSPDSTFIIVPKVLISDVCG